MHRVRVIAIVIALVAAGASLFAAGRAFAHCDSVRGPVIPEAKACLEKGDVTPVLKWVKPEHESEIKTAFARAIAVRGQGPEAREVADQYFLETLIRLHRAGEGAPYTGIKDEPIEPIIAMADQALAEGSDADMIKRVSAHMAAEIQKKYRKALEAKKNKDTSVEAGRAYVEAYVIYMHYVENIHAAIEAGGAHSAGSGEHAH